MGTFEQATEREGMFTVFRLIPSREYILKPDRKAAPKRVARECPLYSTPLPNEIRQVKPVLQDRLEMRSSETKSEFIQDCLTQRDERVLLRLNVKALRRLSQGFLLLRGGPGRLDGLV